MSMLARALTTSFLVVSTLALGCAFEDDATETPTRGAGGKADELDGAQLCDGATLDAQGVCRLGSGRFAPSSCCADEFACQNHASIDAGGTCRNSQSGRFLPATCCDALCEGAGIVNGFCRNVETGQFMLSACCADICFDLSMGAGFLPGSCEDACGGPSDDGCFCDEFCSEEGDCCEDIADACPDLDAPVPEASCEGFCGGSHPSETCWCDEACSDLGDCCGDKVAQCGGSGSDAVIACEADVCDGATVDANFVCRQPSGRFANAACCGLDKCADADAIDGPDGRMACVDRGVGDDVPMVCCAQRCGDAALDRHGICRKGDGTFADPSCCADQCFVAQQRGTGTLAFDACNGAQAVPD